MLSDPLRKKNASVAIIVLRINKKAENSRITYLYGIFKG